MEFILVTVFLGVSFFVGRKIESNHIKDILQREKATAHLPYRNTGLKETFNNQQGYLVYGSVVVSHDAFKGFIMGLINIIGGRVTVYESLLERARRESLLRLKEKALELGAKEVVNFRMQTSEIGRDASSGRSSGAVEIFCVATALNEI